jgi:Superfamily II DNA helicase
MTFRPSYLEIKTLRELKPNLALIALTATATKEVVNDIHEKTIY